MASGSSYVALAIILAIGYLSYKYLVGGPDVVNEAPPPSINVTAANSTGGAGGDTNVGDISTRNVNEKMARYNKNTVIFYGSQTGTAEDFALKLSKELSSRFGLKTMTADLDDYDLDCLHEFPKSNLAVFVMASYGEGDPTDNAQEFYEYLMNGPTFGDDDSEELPDFHFTVFGLGNSSYEFFNKIGRDVHRAFNGLNAQAVGPYGEGDDGKGTLEEDFMAWKEELFQALVTDWGLEEHEPVYEPTIKIDEVKNDNAEDSNKLGEITPAQESSVYSSNVYLGEPNLKHLVASKTNSLSQPPYTQSNPAVVDVVSARDVFKNSDRTCVHMEFDTKGIKYVTGDHLAFWPQNSNAEVERFIKAFGITNPGQVIAISLLDSTSIVRVPSPTTYATVIRHWLEINGPVSRQVLASIAPYAPNAEVKAAANKLASDKTIFASEVTAKCYNISRLMLDLSKGESWSAVPFTFVIETIATLQPRYYSISSSNLADPEKISITAVVEKSTPKGSDHEVCGVATTHILALERKLNGDAAGAKTHRLEGPRGLYTQGPTGSRALVHVRHSLFKLPAKPTVPIIMVGAGTGVAPFRGFVHDRATMKARGREVGPALLFFGNRNRANDFLFEEEWEKCDDWLDVITAFSRDSDVKVYVQHLLMEHSKRVNELITQGAMFYVCGDASKMARDVHRTLIDVVAKEQDIPRDQAETIIKKMKARDKYQEDVW